MWCTTLFLFVAMLVASTSCAFAPPPSAAAFGLSFHRQQQLAASIIISNNNANRARIASSSSLGGHRRHSSNTLEIDDRATRNNSNYEESSLLELESSVIEKNNGVAALSDSEAHVDHEACLLFDNDDDDEIEELFTSLLHKVGKYNAEAVTVSYPNNNDAAANNNHTQPISMLRQAFNIAREAHKNQCRKSGEPYITHPLGVAHIIADMELDLASLLTALLHDTVEDTIMTLSDIEDMFGEEISQCVDGVTKIAKIAFTSYEEQQSENYRKLILAMSKDIVSFFCRPFLLLV